MFLISIVDIEDLKDNITDSNMTSTHKIECLERLVKEKDAIIEQLLEQMNQMKISYHALFERTENESLVGSTSQTTINECAENGFPGDSLVEKQTHVANIPINDDESYFNTYAHFDIHYDMLSVSVKRQISFYSEFFLSYYIQKETNKN